MMNATMKYELNELKTSSTVFDPATVVTLLQRSELHVDVYRSYKHRMQDVFVVKTERSTPTELVLRFI